MGDQLKYLVPDDSDEIDLHSCALSACSNINEAIGHLNGSFSSAGQNCCGVGQGVNCASMRAGLYQPSCIGPLLLSPAIWALPADWRCQNPRETNTGMVNMLALGRSRTALPIVEK